MAFAYTEATNIVVATDGTSGTPLTFADFVTADRAGEAVLLAATAGLSPTLAFDYQIRPVEDLALLISFIVASKSAEADFIFITGTDFAGNAQTESLDVTAGDGTYVSTLYFKTITNIDCSDNAAGGGTQWADGTVAVTQPQWGVIWDYGNGQYQIDAIFDIGVGGTPTYFQSKTEHVFFYNCHPKVISSGTLLLGKLQGDWGVDGSDWYIQNIATTALCAVGGTLLIYASHFHITPGTSAGTTVNGIVDIRNSILSSDCAYTAGKYRSYIWFASNLTSLDIRKTYISNYYRFSIDVVPDTFTKNHYHYGRSGLMKSSASGFSVTLDNFKITEISLNDIDTFGAANHTEMVDSEFTMDGANFGIAAADMVIYEGYKSNINVSDKDGVALSGVSILIEDKNGDTVSYIASGSLLNEQVSIAETAIDVDDGTDFTIGQTIRVNREYMSVDNISSNTITVTRETKVDYTPDAEHRDNAPVYIHQAILTDVNGDIAEQVIAYKKWEGTSETLTTHSPHKFTISKAGYETLVLENITVDAPINWHLELQPLRARVYGRSHRVQAAQFI